MAGPCRPDSLLVSQCRTEGKISDVVPSLIAASDTAHTVLITRCMPWERRLAYRDAGGSSGSLVSHFRSHSCPRAAAHPRATCVASWHELCAGLMGTLQLVQRQPFAHRLWRTVRSLNSARTCNFILSEHKSELQVDFSAFPPQEQRAQCDEL